MFAIEPESHLCTSTLSRLSKGVCILFDVGAPLSTHSSVEINPRSFFIKKHFMCLHITQHMPHPNDTTALLQPSLITANFDTTFKSSYTTESADAASFYCSCYTVAIVTSAAVTTRHHHAEAETEEDTMNMPLSWIIE